MRRTSPWQGREDVLRLHPARRRQVGSGPRPLDRAPEHRSRRRKPERARPARSRLRLHHLSSAAPGVMSLAETPEPKTADEETRFLSVSIPVVSGHLKHTVTVSRARDEIRHAALRLSLNLAGSNTRRLADKLEHATGCTIEALA